MTTLRALLQDRAADTAAGASFTWLDDRVEAYQRLTLHDLDRQARAIAVALQPLALAGERALLLYPPTLDFIAAFFGCLYARIIAVPAYAMSGKRDSQRIRGILHDARPAVVLTRAAERDGTQATVAAFEPDGLPVLATDTVDLAAADTWRDPGASGEELAYLQYTSGSTSAPRGVMISHRNVLSNLAYIAARGDFTADSRSVSWLPHFHDMGLIYGILQPLFSRFPAYLLSPATFVRAPATWLKAITTYRGTHCGGPNFAYDLCVRRADEALKATLDLRSWRVAFNGAEPVEPDTLDRFSRCFTSCGFDRLAFYPVYGLAEATLKVTSPEPGHGALVRTVESRLSVSCGSAGEGTRTLVVDPETREETAAVGEIWVAGPGVADGYWQRPDETQETFGATLASGEGPFLRTGDLGVLVDNQLHITGRLKDCLIIRGRNHYPQDIERTVAASHPALRSTVAAFSIRAAGEERLIVVAELRPQADAPADDLVRAIRHAVSREHNLQAHAVVLVVPSALPRTTSGKLQRQACRAAFLGQTLPAVHTSVLSSTSTTIEHDTLSAQVRSGPASTRAAALDAYLLRLASDVLHLDAGLIDTSASLTLYGHDSLAATDLAHRIQADLGVDLAIGSVAGDISLDQLGARLGEQLASGRGRLPMLASQPTTDRFAASPGQAGLWIAQRSAPQSSADNLFRAVTLSGRVDLDALGRACHALIVRHPALRAHIVDVGGEPWQSIAAADPAPLHIVDAADWPVDHLRRQLETDANRAFDLEQGPLYRLVCYARPAPVLLLAVHHVACDFWSFGILLRDLLDLYQAAGAGAPLAASSRGAHPADYVAWERRLLAREESQLRAYWHTQLAGAPVGSSPFAGRADAVGTRVARQTRHFRIDAPTTARLAELAAASGTTIYATLLAAFAALVFRYTGERDLLIGSPVHRRVRPEFRDLVGHLFNTLVLRIDLSGDPDFATLLGRVRRTVADGVHHGALPLPLLASLLDRPRSPGSSPVCSILFLYQQAQTGDLVPLMPLLFGAPGVRVTAGALDLEAQAVPRADTAFDLTLSMAEIGDEVMGTFECDASVFDEAASARLPAHFRTLLGQALAAPRRHLTELSLLTPTERRRQLVDWNDTARAYPGPLRLHDLVEAQIAATPDAVALTYHEGAVSYAELGRRVARLAAVLRRAGAGPDTLVAFCADRSLELIVGLLAILRAGAAYMPLDPQHPVPRLRRQLEQAAPVVLLGDRRYVDRAADWPGQRIALDGPELDDPGDDEPVAQPDDCMAYVIHTSGSTGVPKGAINTHRAIGHRLLWGQRCYPVSVGDRVLHKTPLTFDVSVTEIFETLMAGGTLVIGRPHVHRHVDALRQLLTREAITIVHFVPTMLRALLDAGGLAGCGAVRRIVCTGEALGADLQTRVFAEARPGIELVNLYGPTEAAVEVTAWTCDAGSPRRDVPIGRPIDNVQAYVLDANFEPCPIDCAGDLYISGVALARGYLGRPDLTAASFLPNPCGVTPGARLYRTGDRAAQDATGVIRYLGRRDSQIKLRGVRIELGEIETVLKTHVTVKDAVAWLTASPRDPALVACVVSDGRALASSMLKTFLSARLPAEMVPSRFALLPALPVLSNGKIDRSALRGMPLAWDETEQVLIAPRTETERRIATICNELLERSSSDVETNLFELGCHSLLAAKLITRINGELRVTLPLAAIFGGVPTIAALARAVDLTLADAGSAAIAHH